MLNFKKLKNEKGQSMVEFALMLPILLVLLFGIIEFSWAMYGKLSLENASREAARAGSVGTTLSEATNYAQDSIDYLVPDHLADSLVDTIIFSAPSSPSEGNIKVTLKVELDPLTPLTGMIGMDSINIQSETVMKMF